MKFEPNHFLLRGFLTVLVLAPILGGCSGGGMGSLSDFSMKDQEWFQRPSKIFGNRALALETPPLSATKPVTQDDLISSEGACPGVAPTGPSDANALQDNGQVPSAPVAPVALGHTECDVARSLGTPNSVNLSRNSRGDRVANIVYLQGPRAGSYTFTAGRLTMIERVDTPAPVKPAKSVKPKKRTAS